MSISYREDRKKWGYRFRRNGKAFKRYCWNTALEAEMAEREAQKSPASYVAPYNGERVLYVIQRGHDGPIKVGISSQLKNRLRELQVANAERLELLRVYRMIDIEKAIHAELRKVGQLEGEWFPANLISVVDEFFKILPLVSWNTGRRIVGKP